jgi:hypothetical protein
MRDRNGAAERSGGRWYAGVASFPLEVASALIGDDLVAITRADSYGQPNRIELNLRGLDVLDASGALIAGAS